MSVSNCGEPASVASAIIDLRRVSLQLLLSTLLWRAKHFVKQNIYRASSQFNSRDQMLPSLKVASYSDTNAIISRAIVENLPFLAGRIGGVEARLLGEYFYKKPFSRLTKRQAHMNAGIFPISKEGLQVAARTLLASVTDLDLIGQWASPYQRQLLNDLLPPSTVISELQSLEPWWSRSPWTSHLIGKKVLIVHPFANTIMDQYKRKGELHGNPDLLPDFDLITHVPPRTMLLSTQDYESWSDALCQMIARVKMIEFDVALIGCGAYGLPLGASIKAMGKPAIHLGGALQLLFGIRGRRWEAIPKYAALMNEFWMRPSREETPAAAAQIDGGCYW